MNVHMYLYTHACTYVYMYFCIYKCTHVYIYTSVCLYIHICPYMFIYIHAYVSTCVYTDMYTYISMYTETQWRRHSVETWGSFRRNIVLFCGDTGISCKYTYLHEEPPKNIDTDTDINEEKESKQRQHPQHRPHAAEHICKLLC